jgi:acid phosphatase family membrane protein YuiD
MDFLNILTNPVLIVPGCAWIIAQVAKTVINAIVNKKFSLDRLVGDGGMPSGHSATVTALAVMCGLSEEGFGSPVFGLAMVFAIVVMHDATGVRAEAGKHARSIISIVEQLNDYLSEHDDKIKTEKLKVLVGHTPLQVFVGSLLGAVIALVYHFLLKN